MTAKRKIAYINASTLKAVRSLPKDIQLQFATDLQRVQNGQTPLSRFKPLKGLGAGIVELIENGGRGPGYRLVYCARYDQAVFILHAFAKTTNGVDRAAMETVRIRIKSMMALIEAADETPPEL